MSGCTACSDSSTKPGSQACPPSYRGLQETLWLGMQRQLYMQGRHVPWLAPLAAEEPPPAATDARAGVTAEGSHA